MKLLIGSVVFCLAIVLLAGCGVPQSEYEALQAEHEALQAELDGLQSDLTDLQADYEAVEAELAETKEVYPPTYFENYDELDDWVSEHCLGDQGTGLLRQNLHLQEEALADGYIWSVEYDRDSAYIISVVIAGDSVYWVWLYGYIEWIAFR